VVGPRHSGCLVAVGVGMGVTNSAEFAGWVEVTTGLDDMACSPTVGATVDKDVAVGVRAGRFRLGPSGLFH
jgi:hypothetical protein